MVEGLAAGLAVALFAGATLRSATGTDASKRERAALSSSEVLRRPENK